jgi:hypothetical protein
VDCIEMHPVAVPPDPSNQAALNRARYDAHSERLLRRTADRQRELDAKKASLAGRVPANP